MTNNYYKLLWIPKIYLFGFISRYINLIIKNIFRRNRPYVTHPEILINEKTAKKKLNTYSLPSNSIQTSLIFYMVLLDSMSFISHPLKIIILTAITLITSSAKIIRGLHYPTDILLSILIFIFVDVIYCLINSYIMFYLQDFKMM